MAQAQPAQVEPWCLYRARQRWGFLVVLFVVCACNYFDQSVLSVVLDPIKREFHVSDTLLGLLSGFCFSLVYALAGLPIARWADRGNRRAVIALALSGWSIATALCGISQSFWQLALARFGLGVAEPGALPPAQSLVADYFPPGRRATPIAVLTQGGSAVGWLAGVALGGYLAARYGWRNVFLLAGAAGLVLAVLVRLYLGEPRTHLGFPSATPGGENIREGFAQLRGKRTFVFLLLGLSVYGIFSFGVTTFVPSFLMRSFSASLAQVSVSLGIAVSAANLVGALGGGWLGDRLGGRDVRRYAALPAISCLTALPLYAFAFRAHDLYSFIWRYSVAEFLASIGMPSLFAATHAVCGHRRRAIAVATLLLSLTLFGSGFGPLLAGWLSDALSSAYGMESLRYSLTAMVAFLLPAAVAFYGATRAMAADLED